MAVQELRTFLDILNAVLEEVKIQSGDTVTVNRIKRDINMIYLNEVASVEEWDWLRDEIDLQLEASVTATAAITQGSRTVTLSAVLAPSKEGALINIQADREVYKIAEHVSGSALVTLETAYVGSTNSAATVKIWSNRIPLPSDTRETYDAWEDVKNTRLLGVGLRKFREFWLVNPQEEGIPRIYTMDDYVDPAPYGAIGSLPALSTRASSGLVKTLVFASTVASLVSVGDRIKISLAGDATYNGKFVISSVSTTTMTYTGVESLEESAAADASLSMEALSQEINVERFRELLVHPSINTDAQLLHVGLIKEPRPLNLDADEPLMGIEDRIVLVYGALSRAWIRERNEEVAQRNTGLFANKLNTMRGKLSDSTDQPQLAVSKTYLEVKRRVQRRFRDFLRD